MDAHEAARIMEAGRAALHYGDYHGTYNLVFPLHESGSLTGEAQGDAAFLVGEACYGLGSMDAAKHYLDEAAATASGAVRRQARARLTDLSQLDSAIGAPEGGITEDEARNMVEAGNDALARGDVAAARAFFQQVYDAPGLEGSLLKAALGLARCHAHDGDLITADQYAGFAEAGAAVKGEAQQLRTWIHEQQTATTMAGDGVSANELYALFNAATAAYNAQSYDRAYELFEQVHSSPQAPTSLRGVVAFNLGVCCLRSQSYDAAHQFFAEAASIGPPGTVTTAHERLQQLADRDEALTTVYVELAEYVE